MPPIESQNLQFAVSASDSMPGVRSGAVPAQERGPAGEPESRAAAARLAHQLAALPDEEVLRVNLDVGHAVARTLGVWSEVESRLPAFARLPGIDFERVRGLRDCALALHHWQGTSTYAIRAVPKLPVLAAAGTALRDGALRDLHALAHHGVLDRALLQRFRGSVGHRKLAQDLEGLSNLVHDQWAHITGRSMLTLEMARECANVGQAILQALGDRAREPNQVANARRQRDRAFTLLIRAYDEARRGMAFLRWHEGDADALLPSLYALRRAARRREVAREVAEPDAPTSPLVASTAAIEAELNEEPDADAGKDSLFGDDVRREGRGGQVRDTWMPWRMPMRRPPDASAWAKEPRVDAPT